MDIQDVEHSQTDSLKCNFSDILSCSGVGNIGFNKNNIHNINSLIFFVIMAHYTTVCYAHL